MSPLPLEKSCHMLHSKNQTITKWFFNNESICFRCACAGQNLYNHIYNISLTVITSNGSTYSNAKLMKSNSLELNWLRSITQISSLISLLVCTFVIVRLKINFGVEYTADFIHTTTITSCNKIWKIKKNFVREIFARLHFFLFEDKKNLKFLNN